MPSIEDEHTHGLACPRCDGRCLHARYSARRLAFRALHDDAYASAYLNGDRAASHELERLDREYRTLPPRHLCTCSPSACAFWTPGGGACVECRRLHEQRTAIKQDVGVEIGRTSAVHPPMPDTDPMDEAYARSRGFTTPRAMAAFLNGDVGGPG